MRKIINAIRGIIDSRRFTMPDTRGFHELLERFPNTEIRVDAAHAALIYGLVISAKPHRILELGIGSGFITRTLIHATKFNGRGDIIAVDSFRYWGNRKPGHVSQLERAGVLIVQAEESHFIAKYHSQFDFIVSDGDHKNSHTWARDIFDLIDVGGMAVFHDVCNPEFPGLATIRQQAEEQNINTMLFSSNSLPGERCHRGLLVIQKKG